MFWSWLLGLLPSPIALKVIDCSLIPRETRQALGFVQAVLASHTQPTPATVQWKLPAGQQRLLKWTTVQGKHTIEERRVKTWGVMVADDSGSAALREFVC